MGNDQSKSQANLNAGKEPSMEEICKKELMKLSWNLIVTAEEQAELNLTSNTSGARSQTEEEETGEQKSEAAMEGKYVVQDSDEEEEDKPEHKDAATLAIEKALSFGGMNIQHPFDVDFGKNFFGNCPDLVERFPTNYQLVTRMITTFITSAIEGTKFHRLARHFGKSHAKYELDDAHYKGFAMALVDTLVYRLGKYSTIEMMKIWREECLKIVGTMQAQHKKYQKRRQDRMAGRMAQ
mmetsp:Transcript_21088/g.29548  ORF Transcript_21088/g.29548 Transcript_21088/m.29548 type:complete len:238 (+) Transcript_21088:106-819(+)|eukprot:CAMPEP_0184482190 /NCGR_PEP_ID=MMETSP0113_2-20130426/3762_1 /TAXON_ID=91329 /ORGANISM="Norrisiella sphaerica, Strain BC52" /LENGTH=237 /DNA_ID=CAMNT_0026861789 /DNA_START=106 /DNA_END=819 /DNA_ORIENTATION=-